MVVVGEDFKEEYRKESLVSGPSKEFAMPARKWQKDELGRLGIVQEVVRKSTDFLRRIIAPAMEWEESPCRMLAHIATVSPWRSALGGYPRDMETATTERRGTAFGGVRCVAAKTNGERCVTL